MSPVDRARARRRYSSSFCASSGTYSSGRWASTGRSRTAPGRSMTGWRPSWRALLSSTASAQQPRVEVEADRGHVPGLLAAEDVPGPADLEVGQRDLEARPELGGVEDRLQPLARLVAQPLAPAVQQVGVGPPRRAPDPAAELVELGQAKGVGPVDDDRVGVRDVEPGFDDRGADEDVGIARRRTSASPSRARPRPSGRDRPRNGRRAASGGAARPALRWSRPGCGRRRPGRRGRARAGSRRGRGRPTPRPPGSGSAGGPRAASR